MSKRAPKAEAVEPATFEETETATATLEPNYSDTTRAALAGVEQDRKTWTALVYEVVGGAENPPEFLLQRLAPSHGLSESLAVTKFAEDVATVKKLRTAEKQKAVYEERRADFIKQHADEATLQNQLRDMIEDQKKLRSLINKLQNMDRVIGQQNVITRRLGAAFDRI